MCEETRKHGFEREDWEAIPSSTPTTLLSYFHDLGIVLHFGDNPLLRDRVILKPAWATNAVYRIFDDDVIKAQQGRFTRNDCSALWSD